MSAGQSQDMEGNNVMDVDAEGLQEPAPPDNSIHWTRSWIDPLIQLRKLPKEQQNAAMQECSRKLLSRTETPGKPLAAFPFLESMVSLSDTEFDQLERAFSTLATFIYDSPAANARSTDELSNEANTVSGDSKSVLVREATTAASDLHASFFDLPQEAQNAAIALAPSSHMKNTLSIAQEIDQESFKKCITPLVGDIPEIMKLSKNSMETVAGVSQPLFSTVDVELAVRMQECFVALPPRATRAIMEEVPTGAAPIVRAVAMMSPDEVRNVVPQLPAFQESAKALISDGEPTAAQQERRREAVKQIHKVFLEMSLESRDLFADALLPEQARPLAQIYGSLGVDDVDKLLTMLDKIEPANGARSRAKTTLYNRGTVATAGAILIRSETGRLWAWIHGQPFGLRVMCFLLGLALMVAGIAGMIIELISRVRLPEVALEFYIFCFGLILCVLEIKSQMCNFYLGAYLRRYAAGLTSAGGRGLFLLFVGVVSISPWTNGWAGVLNLSTALVAIVLGAALVFLSSQAQRKLESARSRIASSDNLRDAFMQADPFARGKLAPSAIIKLILSLEPPTSLSESELRVAIMQMRTDAAGDIDMEELVRWWEGSSHHASRQTQFTRRTIHENMKSEHWRSMKSSGGGFWMLRMTFVLVGCGYIFLGCHGIVKYLHEEFRHGRKKEEGGSHLSHFRISCRLFSMLAVFSLGALVILLEVHKPLRKAVESSLLFLSKVWGKSLLVMFLSTLAFIQRPLHHEFWNAMIGIIVYCVFLIICLSGCLLEGQGSKLAGLDVEEVSRQFDEIAGDDGKLGSSDLIRLLAICGVHLNRVALEAAYCELDQNGDGRISKQEFLEWTQASMAGWSKEEFISQDPQQRTDTIDIEMAVVERRSDLRPSIEQSFVAPESTRSSASEPLVPPYFTG